MLTRNGSLQVDISSLQPVMISMQAVFLSVQPEMSLMQPLIMSLLLAQRHKHAAMNQGWQEMIKSQPEMIQSRPETNRMQLQRSNYRGYRVITG